MLKVYLDSCCYGRPFDDLTQKTIKYEAEAVKKVVELSESGKLILTSSEFVKYEINQIRLEEKRDKILDFYRCNEYYTSTGTIGKLAKYYQTFNLKTFDALHLALAELSSVDYLLTTDVDFIRFQACFTHKIKVVNPCEFIKEEFSNATLS